MSLGFKLNEKKKTEIKNKNPLKFRIRRKIHVKETLQEENELKPNYFWLFGSLIASFTTGLTFLLISLPTYQPEQSYIAPSLAVISFFISMFQWIQQMLAMNLFRKKVPYARWSALGIYFIASWCVFSSSIAVMQRNWILQFASSLTASMIGWLGFQTIFAGEFITPTRQQIGALAQILLLSFLWELRTFVVNMHFESENDL